MLALITENVVYRIFYTSKISLQAEEDSFMAVGPSIETTPPLDVVSAQPPADVANNSNRQPTVPQPLGVSEAGVTVTLSDDGRVIQTEDMFGADLACPVCSKIFPPMALQELQFHVDEHLKTNLVSFFVSI